MTLGQAAEVGGRPGARAAGVVKSASTFCLASSRAADGGPVVVLEAPGDEVEPVVRLAEEGLRGRRRVAAGACSAASHRPAAIERSLAVATVCPAIVTDAGAVVVGAVEVVVSAAADVVTWPVVVDSPRPTACRPNRRRHATSARVAKTRAARGAVRAIPTMLGTPSRRRIGPGFG